MQRADARPMTRARPLIAHVIHRFAMGGMENGLVNLINGMDDRFRHAIVCLDTHTDFASRLTRDDVILHAVNKAQGMDPGHYWRVWQALRRMQPAVVHTRNIGTIEAGVVARLGATKNVIHGEHGFDVQDLHGANARYRRLRKLASPFIKRFICVSRQIATWLERDIGLPARKVTQIYNGVDTDKFTPQGRELARARLRDLGINADFVVGTIGRLEPVKNPQAALDGFARFIAQPVAQDATALVVVGDGSLRESLVADASQRGLSQRVHFLGARDDVAALLPGFDVFLLPSLNEGISNTILEALACGVPVIASRVGGNQELFDEHEHGAFFDSNDTQALAQALVRMLGDPELSARQGQAARAHVVRKFSLATMIERYTQVYAPLCGQ